MEKTMAATAVAAAAVAAVTQTSDSGGVAADQSKGDQGNERRERNSEKTLHFFLQSLECTNVSVRFTRPSTCWNDPGRPPNHSNRDPRCEGPKHSGTTRGTPLQVLQVEAAFQTDNRT